MAKGLKLPLYILFFGLLTFFAAVFGNQPRQEYSSNEVLGRQSGLELFIQPEADRQPILDRINMARSKILVEVYLLSDKEVIAALKTARSRGVTVKVMLEEHPFGGGNLNGVTLPELIASGIETKWANPTFALTHEKAVIIDDQTVCILNQNLTKNAFDKNREYDVCDDNVEEVEEAADIFAADWERKNYAPTAANLVVSPDNSRGKITALIESAKETLDVEMEVLQDQKVVELLATIAKNLPVRVILPPETTISGSAGVMEKLRAEGVEVKTMTSPYPHAKLIVADGKRAYIGSVNLSDQSLDKNRELGILISQPDIVDRLEEQFAKDWRSAGE